MHGGHLDTSASALGEEERQQSVSSEPQLASVLKMRNSCSGK